METTKFKKLSENAYNRYKESVSVEQKDERNLFMLGYQAAILEHSKEIEDLQHFKDSSTGLFATDKFPSEIFKLIITNIDGEKTMSAVDYEYYKQIFDTELTKLLFRL